MSGRVIAWDTFTEAGTSTTVNITSHTATTGGAWTPSATDVNQRFYIDATTDKVRLGAVTTYPAGADMTQLNAVAWNSDIVATVTRGASGTGGVGPQCRAIGTRASKSGTSYLAYFGVGNTNNLAFYRSTSGSYVLVTSASKTITDPAYVRFRAIGSSPTTIQVRAWATSASEPDTWDISTTDNTASNQTATAAPVGLYMESQSASVYATVDEYVAVEMAGEPPIARTRAVTRAATW